MPTPPSKPADQPSLKSRLPASIAEKVQSILLKGRAATVVVDASEIPAGSRDGFEEAIRDMLLEEDTVDEVRVAMMAERAPEPAPPEPEKLVIPPIIAVGSGKGGVGKSTLSANLAVALAKMGRKVGMVDADIYGPSQPKILSNEGERPQAKDEKLIPVPSPYDVPLLSMGHLVPPGQAIAWRGPMAGNALTQLIDARWGDAEVLIVDLPPGTGDVQLTMLSRHKPAGAVIVSTPQDLALIDAQRAAQMFHDGNVPLIGLVENMAGYACPHCGETSDPFGRGGVEAVSGESGIPFLGRIPLDPQIRADSDAGTPPAAGDSEQAESFAAIARQIGDWLDNREAA